MPERSVVERIERAPEAVHFLARARGRKASCLECGSWSSTVRNRSGRYLPGLPVYGRLVIRKIFAERHG